MVKISSQLKPPKKYLPVPPPGEEAPANLGRRLQPALIGAMRRPLVLPGAVLAGEEEPGNPFWLGARRQRHRLRQRIIILGGRLHRGEGVRPPEEGVAAPGGDAVPVGVGDADLTGDEDLPQGVVGAGHHQVGALLLGVQRRLPPNHPRDDRQRVVQVEEDKLGAAARGDGDKAQEILALKGAPLAVPEHLLEAHHHLVGEAEAQPADGGDLLRGEGRHKVDLIFRLRGRWPR